jgi:hypothetical protein
VVDLFGTKRRRRRVQLWRDIATEYGGVYEPSRGYFRRVNEQIRAMVRDVAVVVDTYEVSNGKTSATYSRVTAAVAFAGAPGWSVAREGLLASIGKALGGNDIELGDSAFDSAFVLKSESAATMRRLWTDAARARMLGFPRATVRCDGAAIKLTTMAIWDTADVIRNAVELIVELAGRDLYGARRLRDIEGAVFTYTDRPRAELDTGIRVVIQAEDVGGRLAMVARAADPPALDPLELAITDGKPAAVVALSQAAEVALARVGSGTLVIAPGELRFTWRDLEIDPECLRAGAELLGATARPPEVYR